MKEIRLSPSINQFRYPRAVYKATWKVIVDGEIIDEFAMRELAEEFMRQYCGGEGESDPY